MEAIDSSVPAILTEIADFPAAITHASCTVIGGGSNLAGCMKYRIFLY